MELLVFFDASELAISAVSYLLMHFQDGRRQIGFVIGKSKVAPTSGHTIPRLELCAAVPATGIAETIKDSLGVQFRSVKFFTDSKVVLGYICNQGDSIHMLQIVWRKSGGSVLQTSGISYPLISTQQTMELEVYQLIECMTVGG